MQFHPRDSRCKSPENQSCGPRLETAVAEDCYICKRVWESLSDEQKLCTKSSGFEGINYDVTLKSVNEGNSILAKLNCEPGDDLYDCDDYNVVDGWWEFESGAYAFLNATSKWQAVVP